MTSTPWQHRLRSNQRHAQQRILALWWQINPASIVQSWRELTPAAVETLIVAKSVASVAAEQQLRENFGAGQDQLTPNRRMIAGFATDGRELTPMVEQYAAQALTIIKTGATPQAALERTAGKLRTAITTEIADAHRQTTAAGMVIRPGIYGYIRHVTLPTCPDCLILAGKIFRFNEGFARHPGCDCYHTPITSPDLTAEHSTTDPYAVFEAMGEEEQNRVFGEVDATAIREGADIYQVVNSRNRARTARGRTRPTIDELFDQSRTLPLAAQRPWLREQLIATGYIRGPQTPGGNILGNQPARIGGARGAAIREYERTGRRDPLNRYTMTGRERELYDTHFKLKFYERNGYLPASIYPNSADRGHGRVPASPQLIDDLREKLDRLGNSAIQRPGQLASMQLALEDATLHDLLAAQQRQLEAGGRRATAALGRR